MRLGDFHGLVPVLLILACSPKPAETDAESGSSGPATDGAEASSATQGSDPTNPPDPTTTEPMTSFTTQPPQTASSTPETGDTMATATEHGATDTGDETGGVPDACVAVCMLWEACEPGSAGPLDECVANNCDTQGVDPACAEATDVLWSCVAGLPCEQALSFIEGPPLGCFDELDAADDACAGEPCSGEIGGDGQSCELMQDCDGGEQHIVCDEVQCTCTQDDVLVAECDAMGFCSLEFEEQRAALTECCGWVWK